MWRSRRCRRCRWPRSTAQLIAAAVVLLSVVALGVPKVIVIFAPTRAIVDGMAAPVAPNVT